MTQGTMATTRLSTAGVVQVGQDLPLLQEARDQPIATDHEFDRHLLFELSIIALREVHRAHSTVPDLANEPGLRVHLRTPARGARRAAHAAHGARRVPRE